MKIDDEQHYLVTSFEPPTQTYHLSIIGEEKLDDTDWNGSTRISPIWPVSLSKNVDAPPGNRALTDTSVVCFLGPISPPKIFNSLQTALLSRFGHGDIWLSLGYFNLVLLLNGQEEVQIIRDFCSDNKCVAEFWSILDESDIGDFRCDNIEYFEPESSETEIRETDEPKPTHKKMKDVISSIDASITQAFL